MLGYRKADMMDTSLTKSSSALRPTLSFRTLIATMCSPFVARSSPAKTYQVQVVYSKTLTDLENNYSVDVRNNRRDFGRNDEPFRPLTL